MTDPFAARVAMKILSEVKILGCRATIPSQALERSYDAQEALRLKRSMMEREMGAAIAAEIAQWHERIMVESNRGHDLRIDAEVVVMSRQQLTDLTKAIQSLLPGRQAASAIAL